MERNAVPAACLALLYELLYDTACGRTTGRAKASEASEAGGGGGGRVGGGGTKFQDDRTAPAERGFATPADLQHVTVGFAGGGAPLSEPS